MKQYPIQPVTLDRLRRQRDNVLIAERATIDMLGRDFLNIPLSAQISYDLNAGIIQTDEPDGAGEVPSGPKPRRRGKAKTPAVPHLVDDDRDGNGPIEEKSL